MRKILKDKLERMSALGLLHRNQPEAAPVAEGVDAGGGSSAPLETGSSSDDDSGVDWGNMFNDTDSGDSEPAPRESEPSSQTVEPKKEVSSTPAEPAAPQAATAPVPPQEKTPTSEVSQQPQQPATPAPAEAPAAPVPEQPSQTAEQMQASRAAARNNWVTELKSQYALSEDQASQLVDNPGEVLPQIVAEMHVNVMDNVMQFLRQNMPTMVEQRLTATQQREQAESAFYSQWPELKKHHNLVMEMGRAWRNNNPQASQEDFIKQVGPIAWSAAGLSLQDLVTKTGGAPAPAAAPAPAGPQGGYSPAPQGGGPGPAQRPKDDGNVFASLAEEWQDD